jgi:myo-inositol-1(or 4)-monophosphatase
MLHTLREIGATLLRELRAEPGGQALGRGAAGDRTFPVDKRAEDIILSGLEAAGESLTVISEEAGRVEFRGGGRRMVLVDPLDGSKNAVTGIPLFCTSIAVATGGRLADVELGYIINLVSGEEFWAERGGGAYLDGARIRTREDETLGAALYEAQVPARDLPAVLPLLRAARRTRSLGAVALDLAMVARGAAHVFALAAPSRSFDFAAGWLMAREAGGVVTDIRGGDIGNTELGLGPSASLLAAANPAVHGEALRLLGS